MPMVKGLSPRLHSPHTPQPNQSDQPNEAPKRPSNYIPQPCVTNPTTAPALAISQGGVDAKIPS